MEVSGSDVKKFLWGVVDSHDAEEPNHNDDIGLQEFVFNLLNKDGGG